MSAPCSRQLRQSGLWQLPPPASLRRPELKGPHPPRRIGRRLPHRLPQNRRLVLYAVGSGQARPVEPLASARASSPPTTTPTVCPFSPATSRVVTTPMGLPCSLSLLGTLALSAQARRSRERQVKCNEGDGPASYLRRISSARCRLFSGQTTSSLSLRPTPAFGCHPRSTCGHLLSRLWSAMLTELVSVALCSRAIDLMIPGARFSYEERRARSLGLHGGARLDPRWRCAAVQQYPIKWVSGVRDAPNDPSFRSVRFRVVFSFPSAVHVLD